MAATGGSSKAVGFVIGGAVLLAIGYIIYKLWKLSEAVEALAYNQNQQALDQEPIDVTPETKVKEPSTAIAVSPVETQVKKADEVLTSSTPVIHFSEDYRTVRKNGQEFHLTLNQARIVEKLWQAHTNKTPEVHQSTLLEKLEIYSTRLRDVFKNSEAFNSLVVRGEKRGTFRINV